MNERLIKCRLFFVWEEDKQERWLEEMARQGWHLVKGGLRFIFEKGAPSEMRYRLDYRRRFPHGESEYYAMFRDAGWEHVGDFKQWHYFRSQASANAPEIYTGVESRIDMYRQLRRVLVAVSIFSLVVLGNMARRGRSEWVKAAVFAVVCLFAYGIVRLELRMRKLRATGAR